MTSEQNLEQIRKEEKAAMQMSKLRELWPYVANKIKNNPKKSVGIVIFGLGLIGGGFAMGTFDAEIAGDPNTASDTAQAILGAASIVAMLSGLHLATKKQQTK